MSVPTRMWASAVISAVVIGLTLPVYGQGTLEEIVITARKKKAGFV